MSIDIKKLNLNVSKDVEMYLSNMTLNKIVKNKNNTIFSFYFISKVIIPYYIKEKLESELNKNFIDKKVTCELDIHYEIDKNEYNDDVFNFYNLIKEDLNNYLRKTNKLFSYLFKNSVNEYDKDNNIIIVKVGKNSNLQSVLELFKEEIEQYILNYYNIKINLQVKEDDNITEVAQQKFIEDKKNYYENLRKELFEKEEVANDNNEDKEDRETKEKEVVNYEEKDYQKYIKKKRKSKSGKFYDDNDIQIFGLYSSLEVNTVDYSNIKNNIENIFVKGVIFKVEIKEDLISKKNNRKFSIVEFYITDGEEALLCSMFIFDEYDVKVAKKVLEFGTEVLVMGDALKDDFHNEIVIKNIKSIMKIRNCKMIELASKTESEYFLATNREDKSVEKRVELHLHTKFSDQDGVGDIKDYMTACEKFGMKSIAITDHGVCQALPQAYNFLLKKESDIKLILGVEGYLVDDELVLYTDNEYNSSYDDFDLNNTFVAIDLLTTGINYEKDLIIGIYLTKIKNKNIVDKKVILIKPKRHLTYEEKIKNSIKETDLEEGLIYEDAIKEMVQYVLEDDKVILCAMNIKYVFNFLMKYNEYSVNSDEILDNLKRINYLFDITSMVKFLKRDIKNFKKSKIEKEYNVDKEIKMYDEKDEHKLDNIITAKILISVLNELNDKNNIDNLSVLNNKFKIDDNFIKSLPYYHIIILAKNDVGKVNMYKIISDSFINYFDKKPRIPRSELIKYRDGLIIGSACVQGELMKAIIEGEDDKNLLNIASFYDYLEIQPISNNSFLLNNPKYNYIFKTNEDLIELNKKVVRIGDLLKKLVVATCDCHYVDKEDKIYRTILQYNVWHKKTNIDKNVENDEASSECEELYFRTTEEMLQEFSYLGDDKAYNVVIKNTNLISDMIEKISPVRPDKCAPTIENSDNELRDACMNKAMSIYGKDLPELISHRLDIELHKIIDNGYSLLYITAKRLIDDSVEHGYVVGSRGSVGSSLVAYMIGISEVNPLPPHYVCDNCQYVEIDSEYTRKYNNMTGFDMEKKICPKCGKELRRDGVNIPFDTFLGVEGSEPKEPDIDLNFSDEYQSKAHDKCREIFGDEHTYKAGTVLTVADLTKKTYVKKYYEENNIEISNSDIEFKKIGLSKCKKTTGQHPGGMVVIPADEYIYTFTPIHYPANKSDKGKTTHFEYHEIDKNLLKLDILGQNGPTYIKKLYDATGVDPMQVPFYEDKVISLFQDTSALGIEPKDIHGVELGCLGISEFGTMNTIRMCLESKPKNIADLFRISGLSHGTDVWQGNIRDIVLNGVAKIDECMCCRDDIMLYLNERGLDKETSFDIMEKVRKGKGLKKEWEEKMRDKGIPEWYITCCKKIKYMFPKAHAAAYVSNALRTGYYKVHYPIEFYQVYFSSKHKNFDYELMFGDRETISMRLDAKINEKLKRKGIDINNDDEIDSDTLEDMSVDVEGDGDEFTSNQEKKEDIIINLLRVVEESMARGIEWTKIDIYKANPLDFKIVDGKLMPSLITISGFGEDKVYTFWKKAREKEFTSIEDLIKRGGLTEPLVNKMIDLGIIENMRMSDKITIDEFL